MRGGRLGVQGGVGGICLGVGGVRGGRVVRGVSLGGLDVAGLGVRFGIVGLGGLAGRLGGRRIGCGGLGIWRLVFISGRCGGRIVLGGGGLGILGFTGGGNFVRIGAIVIGGSDRGARLGRLLDLRVHRLGRGGLVLGGGHFGILGGFVRLGCLVVALVRLVGLCGPDGLGLRLGGRVSLVVCLCGRLVVVLLVVVRILVRRLGRILGRSFLHQNREGRCRVGLVGIRLVLRRMQVGRRNPGCR